MNNQLTAKAVKLELSHKAQKEKIADLARFFKTQKGEYGEGDQFMGVTVPDQRKIARRYRELDFEEVEKLLASSIHEVRLTGLLILTYRYERADSKLRKDIYNFYLNNTDKINNWDLVDVSAPKIVGEYLLQNPQERPILLKLGNSKNLWKRRIAVLSTFPLIKSGQFREIEKLAQKLLSDGHDLIYKAVGWMLREVGKIDQDFLLEFLNNYAGKMPRVMLRYAIEKLDPQRRQYYLGITKK
jgi:3-methyladenine DNA glycosylase AlkD